MSILRDIFGRLFTRYEWVPGVFREDSIGLTEIKGENPAGTVVNGMKVNDDGSVNTNDITKRNDIKTISFLSGQSISDEINLGIYQLFALDIPADWEGTILTIQAASESNGAYRDVYDDAQSETEIPIIPNSICVIDVNSLKISSLQYVKFRSGTSALPIVQSADRLLKMICKN